MGTRIYTINGVEVPSVTTVLRILNKPALIAWAWKLGVNGEDYRKKRDDAADVGTMSHGLAEHWMTTGDIKELPPGEDTDLARDLFDKFRAYSEHEGWAAVECIDMDGTARLAEVALVSESFRYGGTLDFVVRDSQNRVLLVDLKTSAKAYPEHFHQLAAYAQLLEENCGIAVDAGVVVCTPKDGSDVKVYECDDLTADWQVFQASLAVYTWQKKRPKIVARPAANGRDV